MRLPLKSDMHESAHNTSVATVLYWLRSVGFGSVLS